MTRYLERATAVQADDRRMTSTPSVTLLIIQAVQLFALAYVLWLPVSQVEVLYPVLLVLAVLGLATSLWRRRVWRPELAFTWMVLVTVILGWAVLGSLVGNPGLTHQILVWLGSSAIWGSWALGLRLSDVRVVVVVITVVIGLISLCIALYILEQEGTLPKIVPQWVVVSQDAGFASDSEGTAIRFLSLSTLVAGGPFVVACATGRKGSLIPPRWLCVPVAVLAFVAAYLCGRRAILAVMTLTPLLMAVASLYLGSREEWSRRLPRQLAMVCLLAAILTLTTLLSLSRSMPRPLRVLAEGAVLIADPGRASGTSPEDSVRVVQARDLLAGWGDHPLLGAGLGARLPSGLVRSVDRPWMFELQYHQMLFQLGLLGSLLVVVALLSSLLGIRRAAVENPEHRSMLAAGLTASVALLIANASNPYLQTPGHWWGVALVLGMVNALYHSQGPTLTHPRHDGGSWRGLRSSFRSRGPLRCSTRRLTTP